MSHGKKLLDVQLSAEAIMHLLGAIQGDLRPGAVQAREGLLAALTQRPTGESS